MNEERNCNIHGVTMYSKRKDGGFRCKKCSIDAVNKRRRFLKIKAIQYKGGSCVKCGYNKSVHALEFHHLDKNEKDFGIGAANKSWEIIKKELDKCILVCANCHREIHSLE